MAISSGRPGLLPGLVLAMCAAVCAVGRASGATAPPKAAAAPIPTITRVAARPFVPTDPDAAPRASLVVRLATAEEQAAVRERLEESGVVFRTLAGTAVVGLGTGLAATAAGMYAGGLIVGGIILLPASVAMYAHEHHTADRVKAALAPETLIEELRAVLPSMAADGTLPLAVDVVILDYGLIQRTASEKDAPLCLVADLGIEARRNGTTVYQETVHVQPYLRSVDAPAPMCRAYEKWGKHDAEVLVRARKDLAASLGTMVRARLTALDWSK